MVLMLLRWGVERSIVGVCKHVFFLLNMICELVLKKILSKFIHCNKIDVRLGVGAIELFDVELNVDYINEKLGTTSVVVLKEGSVRSLMVTRPWKGGGFCGIEVDGLELVLAPRGFKFARDEYDVYEESVNTTTIDKMVKSLVNTTIDKMVKSLVTEFEVKVKKLTVSFDPLQEELGTVLVLRISEVACGTGNNSYLRLSQRSIILAYEGVVLEVHDHLRTGNTTRILSGENGGGLWGCLGLVLPWKNGSLDIGKVHTEFFVFHQELRLQPSTIKCFIYMWGLYNDLCLCESRCLLEKIAALEIRLSVEKRNARKNRIVVSLSFIFLVIILDFIVCASNMHVI